jgi:superfamily II DNA or RNA helicase
LESTRWYIAIEVSTWGLWGIEFEHELGLNVLQRMLAKGFDTLKCDELECMAFNISLDLVLRLFEKNDNLKKITIWSNSGKIMYSPDKYGKIDGLLKSNKLMFFNIPENVAYVHAKLYLFKKEGQVQFLAVGSPNLTEYSNLNFECVVYLTDVNKCNEIWIDIPRIYMNLNLTPKQEFPLIPPECPKVDLQIDQALLKNLWKHQIEIVTWLQNKQSSIVNIPPGTGKTKIAFTYLRHIFSKDPDITAVILVPTTTLLNQWITLLEVAEIPSMEWGTNLNNLGCYFADPCHRVIVTLYSRFFEQYREYCKKIKILKPNLLLVLDECHNSYGHIDDLREFQNLLRSFGASIHSIGLSATIDSFRVDEVKNLVTLMGGSDNRFEITLPRFYSYWNKLNSTPVLKPIKYVPLKYCLTPAEMDEFKNLSKNVAIQMGKVCVGGNNEPTAAIKRARWLRSLPGGELLLQNYISVHIDDFVDKATIIFVQTHEIAERLRGFVTSRSGWNNESSAYVYDSSKSEQHLNYSFEKFKANVGFCLISEKMLSEGFDLPKVDRIILHGSDKSERDWIQKIGRAMRFDPKNKESVAEIIDIVFCEPNGIPLLLERERYETLLSINQMRNG